MATNNLPTGYITYRNGLLTELQDNCKILALGISSNKITPSNFRDIWEKEKDDCIKVKKQIIEEDEFFEISSLEYIGFSGFNTIYYLTISGDLLGVSIFSETQKFLIKEKLYSLEVSIIKIRLNFTLTSGKDIDITFYNSLEPIREKLTTPAGNNDWNYSSKSKIKSTWENKDKYLKYTSSVFSLLLDNNYGIITDFNFITQLQSWSNNNLLDTINIEKESDIVLVGMYSEPGQELKLSVFEYQISSGTYKVQSLFEKNRFGKPKIYTINTISEISGAKPNWIGSRYIGYSLDKIYDIFMNNWLSLPMPAYLNQELIKPLLLYYSGQPTYDFNRPESFSEFIGKLGSWWVWKNPLNNTELYINYNGSLKVQANEKIIPIGPRLILSLYDTIGFNGDTITVTTLYFIALGLDLKTHKYIECTNNKSILYKKAVCTDENYNGNYYISHKEGLYILAPNMIPSEQLTWYENNLIITFQNKNGLLGNQIMDGLRHLPLDGYNIPLFVSAFKGYLWYIDKNNNLRYL